MRIKFLYLTIPLSSFKTPPEPLIDKDNRNVHCTLYWVQGLFHFCFCLVFILLCWSLRVFHLVWYVSLILKNFNQYLLKCVFSVLFLSSSSGFHLQMDVMVLQINDTTPLKGVELVEVTLKMAFLLYTKRTRQKELYKNTVFFSKFVFHRIIWINNFENILYKI